MTKRKPHIYFIAPIDGPGRIKIGWSYDAERRLAAFAGMSPYDLRVVAKAPGDKSGELFIHWRLKHAHVHHEWFNRCTEIDDAIRYISTHGKLPDLLNRYAFPEAEAQYVKETCKGTFRQIVAERKSREAYRADVRRHIRLPDDFIPGAAA